MQAQNFVQGSLTSGSLRAEHISPIDGALLADISVLSQNELQHVFQEMKAMSRTEAMSDMSELNRLAGYFKEHKDTFIKQIILDAGFNRRDATDLVEGSIHFCEYYGKHLQELPLHEIRNSFSFSPDEKTAITLSTTPYGLIAATTPRNTPLITELTILVHALWSGNQIILRASPGVAGTITLLNEGIRASFTPETCKRLSIVFTDAKVFIEESILYADLLHYVGSTKYLETTLIAGIKKGVKVLLDGDGCSTVIIDKTTNISEAAKACYEGLVRCNGEICITIRAILIESSIYDSFVSAFLDLIKTTELTSSLESRPHALGPLFSESQVTAIHDAAKRYPLLSGNMNPSPLGPNYTQPIVVKLGEADTHFLTEQIFGPMVGLGAYSGDGWKRWLKENKINLTEAVFSSDSSFIKEFLSTSNSPRRVVNTDPTIESVFEPWGAFLPSGWNDVSYWYTKYRKPFQLVTQKDNL